MYVTTRPSEMSGWLVKFPWEGSRCSSLAPDLATECSHAEAGARRTGWVILLGIFGAVAIKTIGKKRTR